MPQLTIVECEQGTPEWFAARRGRPSASNFGTVLAKGKTEGAKSITREKYLYELAGEILTEESAESYSNGHMERGKALEQEARDLYAFMRNVEPVRVGYGHIVKAGASPDSLIDANGGLEIKTALPPILFGHIVADRPPPEHLPQVQGNIWVFGREWWDLVIYWPKLPLFVKRIYRDEAYIKRLEAEVDRFNEELFAFTERMRRYGEAA